MPKDSTEWHQYATSRSHHVFLCLPSKICKTLTAFLISCFLVQEMVLAGGIQAISNQTSVGSISSDPILSKSQKNLPIVIPNGFFVLNKFYQGNNGRLVVYIQDAHANYSAQKNIAHGIRELTTRYTDLSTLFTEGGVGNNTLLDLRKFQSPSEWKKGLHSLLMRGDIDGVEYISLISDLDLTVLGMEDWSLYEENLKQFKKIKARLDTKSYLNKVQKSIQKLKTKIYPRSLLEYEEGLLKASPFERILRTIHCGADVKIDLDKYSQLSLLSYATRPLNGIVTNDKKNLEQPINIDVLTKESALLRRDIYNHYLTTDTLKQLHAIDVFVGVLERAFDIRLTTKEYRFLEATINEISSMSWQAFLNTLLIKNELFDYVIHHDPSLEIKIEEVKKFYSTANQRDLAFIENIEKEFDKKGLKKSYILAGGYHADHLTNLLKNRGYSFIVLSPRMEHATNIEEYSDMLISSVDEVGRVGESTLKQPVAASRLSVLKSLVGLIEPIHSKEEAMLAANGILRRFRNARFFYNKKTYLEQAGTRHQTQVDIPINYLEENELFVYLNENIANESTSSIRSTILKDPLIGFNALELYGNYLWRLINANPGQDGDRIRDEVIPAYIRLVYSLPKRLRQPLSQDPFISTILHEEHQAHEYLNNLNLVERTRFRSYEYMIDHLVSNELRAESGRGQVVLVSGPSAVGKTSFYESLEKKLAANGRSVYRHATDSDKRDRSFFKKLIDNVRLIALYLLSKEKDFYKFQIKYYQSYYDHKTLGRTIEEIDEKSKQNNSIFIVEGRAAFHLFGRVYPKAKSILLTGDPDVIKDRFEEREGNLVTRNSSWFMRFLYRAMADRADFWQSILLPKRNQVDLVIDLTDFNKPLIKRFSDRGGASGSNGHLSNNGLFQAGQGSRLSLKSIRKALERRFPPDLLRSLRNTIKGNFLKWVGPPYVDFNSDQSNRALEMMWQMIMENSNYPEFTLDVVTNLIERFKELDMDERLEINEALSTLLFSEAYPEQESGINEADPVKRVVSIEGPLIADVDIIFRVDRSGRVRMTKGRFKSGSSGPNAVRVLAQYSPISFQVIGHSSRSVGEVYVNSFPAELNGSKASLSFSDKMWSHFIQPRINIYFFRQRRTTNFLGGFTTKIKDIGDQAAQETLRLIDQMEDAKDHDIAIIGGMVFPGVDPDEYYPRAIHKLQSKGYRVVIDFKNHIPRTHIRSVIRTESLGPSSQAVYMVKANQSEFFRYLGREDSFFDGIPEEQLIDWVGREAVMVARQNNVQFLHVTLAEKGSVVAYKLNGSYQVVHVRSPEIDQNSPWGAGDSYIGGFLSHIPSNPKQLTEEQIFHALRYAVASGAATAEQELVNIGRRNRIDQLFKALHSMHEPGYENGIKKLDATVRIWFAETPHDPIVLKKMDELSAGYGSEFEVVGEPFGEGGISEFRAKLDEYKPTIIVFRTGLKFFKNANSSIFQYASLCGLKAIVRPSSGVDNVDFKAAAKQQISIVRTGGPEDSTAQLTLRLLFRALLNLSEMEKNEGAPSNLISQVREVGNANGWRTFFSIPPSEYADLAKKKIEKLFGASEPAAYLAGVMTKGLLDIDEEKTASALLGLNGKQVGIMGFGPIARVVANILIYLRDTFHLDFDILIHTRTMTTEKLKEEYPYFHRSRVRVVESREEFFSSSDIISLHIPGEDRNAITSDDIEKSPAKIWVNTSRRTLTPLPIIQRIAESNRIFVGDIDPSIELLRLADKFPVQLAITPHIAGSAESARNEVSRKTIHVIGTMLKGIFHEPHAFHRMEIMNARSFEALRPNGYFRPQSTHVSLSEVSREDRILLDLQRSYAKVEALRWGHNFDDLQGRIYDEMLHNRVLAETLDKEKQAQAKIGEGRLIRVASINLLLPGLFQEATIQAAANRYRSMKRVIQDNFKEGMPSIIGSQEVPWVPGIMDPAFEIAEEQGYSYHKHVYDHITLNPGTTESQRIEIALSIAFDKQFNLLEEWSEDFYPDKPRGVHFNRAVFGVKLQSNITGQIVNVFNTHLSPHPTENYLDRQKELVRIRNFIEEHAKGEPFILLGDFNYTGKQEIDEAREILGDEYVDTYMESNEGAGLWGYTAYEDSEFNIHRHPNVRTDMIYARGFDSSHSRIGFTHGASDHEILVSDLEFKDEGISLDGGRLSEIFKSLPKEPAPSASHYSHADFVNLLLLPIGDYFVMDAANRILKVSHDSDGRRAISFGARFSKILGIVMSESTKGVMEDSARFHAIVRSGEAFDVVDGARLVNGAHMPTKEISIRTPRHLRKYPVNPLKPALDKNAFSSLRIAWRKAAKNHKRLVFLIDPKDANKTLHIESKVANAAELLNHDKHALEVQIRYDVNMQDAEEVNSFLSSHPNSKPVIFTSDTNRINLDQLEGVGIMPLPAMNGYGIEFEYAMAVNAIFYGLKLKDAQDFAAESSAWKAMIGRGTPRRISKLMYSFNGGVSHLKSVFEFRIRRVPIERIMNRLDDLREALTSA